MKARPHDSPESRSRSGHRTTGGQGSGQQEAELVGKRNGTFLSYIKDEDEEANKLEVSGVDTSSSGSSPMSHSPGGDEEDEEDEGEGPDGGEGLMMGEEYSPKATRRVGGVDGEDEDEDDDEEGNGMKAVTKKKHSYSYLRKHGVSSGGRRGDNEGEGPGGNPLGGSRAGGPSSFSSKGFDRIGASSVDGMGGRSSNRPYPIRRHGSNESMSSQSTLVAKQLGGDNDTVSSITDILRPSATGCGLTLSNIQDHIRNENSRHYHHHHHHHHRRREEDEEEEEEDEDEEYGRGRVGMSASSSRRTSHHRGGGRRGDRRTGSGRKTKTEAKGGEKDGELGAGLGGTCMLLFVAE